MSGGFAKSLEGFGSSFKKEVKRHYTAKFGMASICETVPRKENYVDLDPEAKDVYADDFERVLSQLAPNHSSYLVIVTRGHRDDMRVLRWAVETPAKYIGMIGSQRKVIAIYKELEKKAFRPRSWHAFMPQSESISERLRQRRSRSQSSRR